MKSGFRGCSLGIRVQASWTMASSMRSRPRCARRTRLFLFRPSCFPRPPPYISLRAFAAKGFVGVFLAELTSIHIVGTDLHTAGPLPSPHAAVFPSPQGELPIRGQERHLQGLRLHGGHPCARRHRLQGCAGRRRAVPDGRRL